MKIYFPNNLFGHIVGESYQSTLKENIQFINSNEISKRINEEDNSAGMIPTLDLINNRNFFVSAKTGISFDGALNPGYYYYGENQKSLTDIYLTGDVTSVEVILTKVLLSELYNISPQIHITVNKRPEKDKTFLVVGDLNFSEGIAMSGVSLSEEIEDHLEVPFVNFIMASREESTMKEINKNLSEINESLNWQDLTRSYNFSEDTNEYIENNISSLISQFDERDLEGIRQLLLLPYYYQMIDDMIEVKFVD